MHPQLINKINIKNHIISDANDSIKNLSHDSYGNTFPNFGVKNGDSTCSIS